MTVLLALVLAAGPAQACPADVGKSDKALAEISLILAEAWEKLVRTPAPGDSYRELAENRQRAVASRGDVLSHRLNLGYAYLKAGCREEARKTFEEVWGWNQPQYAPYPQQARDALNLMLASKL